jgi:hypothetical protein
MISSLLPQIFETNVLNLLAVWICLYLVLREPFTRAIESYTENQRLNRANLEKMYMGAKQKASNINSLKTESIKFANFVTSKNDGWLTENPSFEFNEPLCIQIVPSELSSDRIESKLSSLLSRSFVIVND